MDSWKILNDDMDGAFDEFGNPAGCWGCLVILGGFVLTVLFAFFIALWVGP